MKFRKNRKISSKYSMREKHFLRNKANSSSKGAEPDRKNATFGTRNSSIMPLPIITDAALGLSADSSARTRKYLISMTIRTMCFIATILLPSPWRWVTLVGAIFLPYVAVVIANAGREPNNATFTSYNNRELP